MSEKWPNFKKPPTGEFDIKAFKEAFEKMEFQPHLTKADADKIAKYAKEKDK